MSQRVVATDEAAADGKVRRQVLELYVRAAADWVRAPSELARGLRGARALRSFERRFVSEAVYGLVRWRRRLAFLATAANDAPPELLYLAWLAQERGLTPEVREELSARGVDPQRLAKPGALLDAISDPLERLAVRESYPTWLVTQLAGERGLEDTALLLAAMNRRAPLTVRANRLKNTRDELQEILAREQVGARPHPLAPDALELDTHLNAYGLTAFREGRFELQDAGSQLIAELTAPPPRGLVVDACAGAGGKTLALGALLGNRGRLWAFDVSERKLEELRERVRRAGLTNVQALAVPDAANRPQHGDDPLAQLVGRADRVLCDAPCSGLGVLRRNPEARWRLQPADLVQLPRTQRKILDTYATLVAPGGRLVYATCTVDEAENDQVVAGFLGDHPEFEEVAAKEILGSARALAIGDGMRLRLWPHRHGTDGFFAAVLRRRG